MDTSSRKLSPTVFFDISRGGLSPESKKANLFFLKSQSALLFLVLLYCGFIAAKAQPTERAVRGTVTDAGGALIAGAKVDLLDAAGKTIAQYQTGGNGDFRFEIKAAGEYRLKVSQKGMSQKIVAIPAATEQIEIVLEPGQVRAAVTVAAESELVTRESETVTKTATPLKDLPQSVEIVNNRLMQVQGVRSLQDALYNVTAVVVAQGEGRRDNFYIRGFNAVGDQFIDGVRDDAQYYRDLANIEQIEVVKGPAAVLFGRGSSGGLINRVTKRPNFQSRVGGAEISFGSYALKRGSFDFGQPILEDKLAFRFIAAYEQSGSFRQFYFLDRYNIAPSLAWRPADKTDVLLQFEYLNDNRLPDRGIPSFRGEALDVPIATYYGDPASDEAISRVSSQAVRLEHRFNNLWLIRSVFRHTGYATDFYNTGPNGVCLLNSASGACSANVPASVSGDDGRLRVTRFQYSSDSRQDNFFNQTEAVGNFRFLGWQHNVLGGLELGSQSKKTNRSDRAMSPVTFLNPNLTPPASASNTTTDNRFSAKVAGVYFQDQINFNRHWKALIGARYDSFEQKLNNLLISAPTLERTDRQWSPRAGLVYQPQEWLSLYASYTRSFQPSGENLSLAANNAELKPEMTRNYEFGIKAEVPQWRLNATLAAFRLDRDNIKTTDPQNPARLLLVGEQRTDGIEATVSGSPLRKLRFTAGYALLSARITKSNNVSAGIPLEGRRAGLIPQGSGNLWLSYSLPKNFSVGFGAFGRSNIFTSANNLVTLPGFVRLEASFAWRSERHYEIAFNLRNIANRRYYETSNGDNGILAGSPVNGSVSLRYRW